MANHSLTRYFLYLISLLAGVCSFYYYGPLNYHFFNSDQAVQVLMTTSFEWPADAYYWGQNRLGSFLPILGVPIYKLFGIHPIWVLGILNFAFILISYWVIQPYLKSIWGNLLVVGILFFPHPTYIYLNLIGHPYAGQILCLTLSIHYFIRFKNSFLESFERPTTKVYWQLIISIFFSILSIWINELSTMVYLGYFLTLYPIKIGSDLFFIYALKEWKNLIKLWVSFIASLIFGIAFILYSKANSYTDPSYGRIFITTISTIIEQGKNLINQILSILFLSNHHSIFQCVFYYSFAGIVLLILKKKKGYDVVFKTLLVSSILLFFVYWNYRSNFDAKYYIPIYVGAFVWLAYHINSFSKSTQFILFLMLAIPLYLSNTDYISITRNNKNTLQMFEQADAIPDGIAYGEYWDVYRLSGATAGRIQGISKNEWDFRNRHKINSLLTYDYWFLYAKNLNDSAKKTGSEQILLERIHLKNSGKKYPLQNDTLYEFIKLGSEKYNLK